MTEQRSRMTYEQQRALREQQGSGTASRYSIDRYGSGSKAKPTARKRATQPKRARPAAERQADQTRSSRSAARQRTSANRRVVQGAGDGRQRATRQGSGRRQASSQYARGNYRSANAAGAAATVKQLPLAKIAVVAVLLVAVVLAVQLCSAVTPITVTVNGSQYELRGSKNMESAIKASGLPINPGDFISLQGNVLEKSQGHPFSATVNDSQTADPGYRLRNGDVINITDGDDIVEDYDTVQESIPYGATITGAGAVHEFQEGTEGVKEIRTGKVSGETVEKQVVDPIDITCNEYNMNSGAAKIIAFTFDDGPSSEYTAAVLDILAENDAKATFFCIGTEVESYPELVKRAYSEGHQICTHSYDHADPVGGTDISHMDAAGQVDEIVHGNKTITDVIGGEASRVVRLPGGNISEDVVKNLMPYVDYEIGWNIDTLDWTLPGADKIYGEMTSAQPGEIILCHDGGGDRSETVEALRKALPQLKAQGYSFVTVDELLAKAAPK